MPASQSIGWSVVSQSVSQSVNCYFVSYSIDLSVSLSSSQLVALPMIFYKQTSNSFQVTGKFSIRLVPNQNIDDVTANVMDHLDKTYKDRGSPNELK